MTTSRMLAYIAKLVVIIMEETTPDRIGSTLYQNTIFSQVLNVGTIGNRAARLDFIQNKLVNF